MVGVPGKSQACNTCRSRKVLCDLQKPHCARCLKAGRECGGYQRDRVFINRGKDEAPLPGTGNRVIRTALRETRERQNKSTVSPNSLQVAEYSGRSRIGLDVNSGREYRSQFLAHLLNVYLPASNLTPTHPEFRPVSFVSFIPDLINSSPILDAAFDAFSVMVLSHTRHDDRLRNDCLPLHLTALGELQKGIADPKVRTKDETLAALSLLSLYQLFECTKSWMSHAKGGQQLLRLRDPIVGNSKFSQTLYLRFLQSSLFDGLSRRKSLVLPEKPYVRSYRGPITGFHKEILDIGVKIPGLLERLDILGDRGSSLTFINNGMQVAIELWGVNAQFKNWFERLEQSTPVSIYESKESDVNVFGKVLVFRDLYTAQLMTIYWTCLIFLYNAMLKIHQILETAHNTARTTDTATLAPLSGGYISLRPVPTASDIVDFARCIYQSLDYCQSKEMGVLGVQVTLFPMWIGIQTYLDHPEVSKEEMAWCWKEFTTIRAKYGFRVGDLSVAEKIRWAMEDTL